jgi:hypothetical protein
MSYLTRCKLEAHYLLEFGINNADDLARQVMPMQ